MNDDYQPREIASPLKKALPQMPVVVLTGLRQTGKSKILIRDPKLTGRQYGNLDDFDILEILKENPDPFLTSMKSVSIDEVQRLPDYFLVIKRLVDRNRKPGAFLPSGSANPGLLKGVAESLAGRAIYFELLPMTRRELSGATRRKPFIASLLSKPGLPSKRSFDPVTISEVETGGMPPVALNLVDDRDLWFRGYCHE